MGAHSNIDFKLAFLLPLTLVLCLVKTILRFCLLPLDNLCFSLSSQLQGKHPVQKVHDHSYVQTIQTNNYQIIVARYWAECVTNQHVLIMQELDNRSSSDCLHVCAKWRVWRAYMYVVHHCNCAEVCFAPSVCTLHNQPMFIYVLMSHHLDGAQCDVVSRAEFLWPIQRTERRYQTCYFSATQCIKQNKKLVSHDLGHAKYKASPVSIWLHLWVPLTQYYYRKMWRFPVRMYILLHPQITSVILISRNPFPGKILKLMCVIMNEVVNTSTLIFSLGELWNCGPAGLSFL